MAEPVLVGTKTESGNIYLTWLRPKSLWQRLTKWLAGALWWLLQIAVAFLAGLIVGSCW